MPFFLLFFLSSRARITEVVTVVRWVWEKGVKVFSCRMVYLWICCTFLHYFVHSVYLDFYSFIHIMVVGLCRIASRTRLLRGGVVTSYNASISPVLYHRVLSLF